MSRSGECPDCAETDAAYRLLEEENERLTQALKGVVAACDMAGNGLVSAVGLKEFCQHALGPFG